MMKKLSLYIFLVLMFCNVGFSEEPTFDYRDMNKNIIEHGWKVKKSTMTKLKTVPVEIYTLTKGNWILKCQILYMHDEMETFCMTP